MFTEKDLQQIEKHGLTPDAVERQLENFRRGFPFLKVVRAASPGDGVMVVGDAEAAAAVARYEREADRLGIVKFVPASGAATRMFKELFEFVNEGKRGKGIDTLLDNIGRFAFWPELKAVLPPDADDKATVRAIVKDGLGYGQKPKGLVTFHAYPEGARKAVEEHLVEGAVYAAARGVARIHFTVSPEHIAGFETLLAEKVPVYERRFGIRYDISFSVQKPSTDTIAVNPDNTPFRQDDGTLRAIVHYKDYEPMFEHYGVPPYIAGFGVSAIAYKTDRWNISRLDNSFQLSGVMMLDSTMDDEAQAERIMRTAEEKFAGNPGQVMFVLREGAAEDHSRFIPIASQNEGDWRSLHEQATSDIVVAHSWFRTLSGLDYASGFSAERILHEYEIALNTVILGEQAELLEPIREIIGRILGADPSSLEIVNRPPTRSKPLYMKVWEARKADGLDYDPEDERQQHFLAEITKYNLRSID